MNRIAIVLSAALVLLSVGGARLAEADERPKSPTMQGTVIDLDAQAREVRMVSGTGHALRVVTFVVEPQCAIRVAGVAAELDDLDRGRVVKIVYRVAERRYVAESIETMRIPDKRGRP